jgi:hypothetical protein
MYIFVYIHELEHGSLVYTKYLKIRGTGGAISFKKIRRMELGNTQQKKKIMEMGKIEEKIARYGNY